MKKDSSGTLTRSQLESLSTEELISLADGFGIDIPPALERIFIIEELLECIDLERIDLECIDADNQKIKEDILINPSYSETAVLPKQYNISYIEVIIRDPLWAFVFWEIKSHDKEIHENADDFNGYCLRIVPSNKEETEFIVPIDKEDCARYLGFAEPSISVNSSVNSSANSSIDSSTNMAYTKCSYIIKLCAVHGDSESQIAVSAPFCLPRLIENEIINEMKKNPLVCLSGVQDISITKCIDRQSRIKGQ